MSYIEKLNSVLVGRVVRKKNDLDNKVRILQLNNDGTATIKCLNNFVCNVSFISLIRKFCF